jgi:hypothetical protein
MFWRRAKRESRTLDEDRAIRTLLEAASTPPGDRRPGAYFMTRVRARVAEGKARAAEHPVGAAAWQMLPALAAVVVALSAWTSFQSLEASRERAEIVAKMLGHEGGAGEVLITAVLLGGSADDGRTK